MNQTTSMTTREAVKTALYALADTYTAIQGQPDAKIEVLASMDTLCEAYNFKRSDFFLD